MIKRDINATSNYFHYNGTRRSVQLWVDFEQFTALFSICCRSQSCNSAWMLEPWVLHVAAERASVGKGGFGEQRLNLVASAQRSAPSTLTSWDRPHRVKSLIVSQEGFKGPRLCKNYVVYHWYVTWLSMYLILWEKIVLGMSGMSTYIF